MAQETGSDTSALTETLRSELATMRAEFHQLLERLAEADSSSPMSAPAWSGERSTDE